MNDKKILRNLKSLGISSKEAKKILETIKRHRRPRLKLVNINRTEDERKD